MKYSRDNVPRPKRPHLRAFQQIMDRKIGFEQGDETPSWLSRLWSSTDLA